jgi:hypothetical protein
VRSCRGMTAVCNWWGWWSGWCVEGVDDDRLLYVVVQSMLHYALSQAAPLRCSARRAVSSIVLVDGGLCVWQCCLLGSPAAGSAEQQEDAGNDPCCVPPSCVAHCST